MIRTHAIRAKAVCYRRGPAGPEFLLVRARAGGWTLPGGRVEPDETPAIAAAREAHEEAGVTGSVAPEPVAWCWTIRSPVEVLAGPRLRTPVFLLEVTGATGRPEPGRDPRWCSAAEADRLLRDGRWAVTQGRARALRRAAEKLERVGGAASEPAP